METLDISAMTRYEIRNRVEQLLKELVDVEAKLEDETTSHSDQELLDQAWEDLTDQIAFLEEVIEMEDEARQAGLTRAELEEYNGAEYDDECDAVDYYEADFGVYYDASDEV